MRHETASIDISTMPDLARLADEVARTRTPRVLRRGNEDIAVLSPTRPKRRPKSKRVTEEDIAASLAAAGAWQDWVDPEAFKRERRELQEHDRELRSL
jgi:hypothetical protein